MEAETQRQIQAARNLIAKTQISIRLAKEGMAQSWLLISKTEQFLATFRDGHAAKYQMQRKRDATSR